jgi:hypothetical protein
MDNIIELKNYTMSKLKNKQITLNYLKNNNIKYFKLFNTIVSFPITSIQYENLHCIYTKYYYKFNTVFLIHKY